MAPAACVMIAAACILAQSERQSRLPTPSSEQQQAALTIVNELGYRDAYVNAGSNKDKLALANELIEAAKKTNDDPPGRYVLLRVARDIAVQVGDYDMAARTIDTIAETFTIDALQMKADAIVRVASVESVVGGHGSLFAHLTTLFTDAVTISDYETARKLVDAATTLAAAPAATTFQNESRELAEELTALERLWEESKQAAKVLESDKTDGAASHVVGTYACFVQGDWKRGLRLLAFSSDADVKTLAIEELAAPEDPQAQLSVADAWWSMGEKHSGIRQRHIRLHAAEWYTRVGPRLFGLNKQRVEKRLATVGNVGAEMAAVDMLKLVDPSTDAIEVSWIRERGPCTWSRDTNSAVTGNRGHGFLQFPIKLSGSYDLEIKFARQKGGDLGTLLQVPVAAGHAHIVMGASGNHRLEDVRDERQLEEGERTLSVKVRVKGEQAEIVTLLDGKPFLQGDWRLSDLKKDEWIPDQQGVVAIGKWDCVLRIISATVTPISGTATPAR